jgi:hypothetical protein
MPDLIPCPDTNCGASAEIVDRWTFASSEGPVAHVRTRCTRGHVFTPTVDSLPVPATAQARGLAGVSGS